MGRVMCSSAARWAALVAVAWLVVVPSALGFEQVPGSPFATSYVPAGIAFSPGGHLLATAGYSDVSVFSVNPRTGALSPLAGSPFSTPSGVMGGCLQSGWWPARDREHQRGQRVGVLDRSGDLLCSRVSREVAGGQRAPERQRQAR